MDYSDSIYELRKAKGVTQEELAYVIGTSRQIVSRWESGVNVPSLAFAERLAAYFGVSIDELMGKRDGEVRPTAEARKPAPSSALTALKSKVRLISFLTFAPTVLFILFQFIEDAVMNAYAVAGIAWAQYYPVIYSLYFFNALFCELLLILLGAFLVYYFVGAMRTARSGFMRFNFYGAFKNGCFFWLWNVLNIVYLNWIEQKFDPRFVGFVACVIGSSLLASFVVLMFDIVYKKRVAGWMTVETSKPLKLVNVVYLALSALNIAEYLVMLTLCFTVWDSANDPAAMLLFYLVFAGIAALLQLYYAVARLLIVRGKKKKL